MKKIMNLLVEIIVLDLRPAAMVEGKGFRALINYVNPNNRVLSAMHITSCLQEKYLQAKSILMQMLKNPSHIVLTTDIWMSVATQAYITITVHFLSANRLVCCRRWIFQKITQLKTLAKDERNFVKF